MKGIRTALDIAIIMIGVPLIAFNDKWEPMLDVSGQLILCKQ